MKRNFPINEEFPLSDQEKEALTKYLDHLEWREYQRVKHLTSGWCSATVEDYNEFEITVFIEWGVDGQWSDDDCITISRDNQLEKV